MRPLTRLFYFTMCLLSGCVPYRARPLAPDQTAAAFEARRLSDPNLLAFVRKYRGAVQDPEMQGWDFDSLTLVALYEHPDLDLARAQWQTAKAAQRTAGERPNPSITFGPTWVSNPDLGLQPWIAGISFDIPIETAGKRGIRQRQAAALAESARQSLLLTAWQIRSGVRTSLIASLVAQRAAMVLRHQSADIEENARLLNQRVQRGEVSGLNAVQATTLAGRSRLSVEDADRQEAEARALVADALAVPTVAIEGLAISTASANVLIDAKAPLLLEARRAALTGRADLLSALAIYTASEAALELEVAKQYPDVHLGPGFSYDQGQNKWGLGVTLPLPILNQNGGMIGEAKARREEAAARFIALQDKIINRVDRALKVSAVAVHRLQTAQEILDTQIRQNRSLQRLLRPGDVSRFTLFRSQLDLGSTEIARDDAWRQALEAQGLLEDALQRPLSGERLLPAELVETNPRRAAR